MFLKDLDCVVINLNRSKDRLENFMSTTAKLFKSVHRLEATDHTHINDNEISVFADTWNRLIKEAIDRNEVKFHSRGTTCMWRRTYTSKQVESSRLMRIHVAAWAALYRSHLRAIELGLSLGCERFIVCEDDASPKPWAASLDSPSSDVVLWGAIPMASFSADASRNHEPKWVNVVRRTDSMCATATEYTKHSANVMLESLKNMAGQWDLIWYEVLKKLDTKFIKPAAFIQVGEPVRGNRNRPNASRFERKSLNN